VNSDPARTGERDQLRGEIRELLVRVRELETRTPGPASGLLASAEAQDRPESALEVLFALQVLLGGPDDPEDTAGRGRVRVEPAGTARKVSVSMPEDLTSAVQRRAGRGKFSQYVTEAVARQLEVDLLTDLSNVLAIEHGPVPPEYLAQARAAWPDDE
jgi:hypothetical protein